MIRGAVWMSIVLCGWFLRAERVSLDLNVCDGDGCTVSNAQVVVYTQRDFLVRSWTGIVKRTKTQTCTDGKGNARVDFVCHHGDFELSVRADGYYPENLVNQAFATSYDAALQKVQFLEKRKTIALVLRKIRNPTALVTIDRPRGWTIPSQVGRYAFDLECADWVAPRGRGKMPDLVISYDVVTNKPGYTLMGRLEFPSGGAYKQKKVPSTTFKSVYTADTNAVYETSFPFNYQMDDAGGDSYQCDIAVGRDEYLVFRTREVRNSRGELISANYGKIYGPVRTSGKLKFEKAFYNPNPNDTNIEERQ